MVFADTADSVLSATVCITVTAFSGNLSKNERGREEVLNSTTMHICQEEQDHLSELSMTGAEIYRAQLKLNKIISYHPQHIMHIPESGKCLIHHPKHKHVLHIPIKPTINTLL